eukprot:gene1823-33242_t
MSLEASEFSKRAAEAELASKMAAAAQREALEAEREATLQLTQVQAEVAAKEGELAALAIKAREDKERFTAQLAGYRRDAERAIREADERKAQLAAAKSREVALEGRAAELLSQLEVRQLAAAKSREVALEGRATELLSQLEVRQSRAAAVQSELQQLTRSNFDTELRLTASEAKLQNASAELSALKARVSQHSNASLKSAMDLDAAHSRVASLEAEVAGLRQALQDCQSRHSETINREREEAAEVLRHVRSESMLQISSSGSKADCGAFSSSFGSNVEGALDEVLSMLRALSNDSSLEGAQATVSVHDSTLVLSRLKDVVLTAETLPQQAAVSVHDSTLVLSRLKDVVLTAETLHQQSTAETRITRHELRTLSTRLAAVQFALDQRTAEWQIAEVSRQHAQRSSERRSQQGASHAAEMAVANEERVLHIMAQLQSTTTRLATASAELSLSSAGLDYERSRVEAALRKQQIIHSEKEEVVARLAASQMEAAGAVEVASPFGTGRCKGAKRAQ